MPSEYITVDDYEEYGLTAADAPRIRKASVMIDNYLDRPEGLVWVPDSLGRPCYMKALAPANAPGSPTLPADIQPGTSVVIGYPYPIYDLIGEVFILDRASTDLCEPVTVTGVDQINNTITLQRVLKPHAAGAPLEAGLVILEERQMPARRSLSRVARPNLTSLLSVVGRYGYGRRSDQMNGYTRELSLIYSLQALGGLDTWQPIDASTCSFSSVTGEVWVMPGLMGDYFNEVRMRFVAGFSAATLPPAIKDATAAILANQSASDDGGTSPIFKIMQAGGTKIERFGDSLFDSDTKAALSTHKLRVMV